MSLPSHTAFNLHTSYLPEYSFDIILPSFHLPFNTRKGNQSVMISLSSGTTRVIESRIKWSSDTLEVYTFFNVSVTHGLKGPARSSVSLLLHTKLVSYQFCPFFRFSYLYNATLSTFSLILQHYPRVHLVCCCGTVAGTGAGNVTVTVTVSVTGTVAVALAFAVTVDGKNLCLRLRAACWGGCGCGCRCGC